MQIVIKMGRYDAEMDAAPDGPVLWEGGDDELPAAALAMISCDFAPGDWQPLSQFAGVIAGMNPAEAEQEVSSAVTASQAGVAAPWLASIAVGQTRAALMLCRSVVEHATTRSDWAGAWVRVD